MSTIVLDMTSGGREEAEPRKRDLANLTRMLMRRFRNRSPRGYVLGKTRMRNALVDLCGVSVLRAERLIDQMHALGFLRYTGSPDTAGRRNAPWRLEPHPLSAS